VWLVLCDDSDASARWVYDGLRERSVPVEFVPASVLSAAVRWIHRVGSDGAFVEVFLADGRCIDSRDVHGTLNRIVSMWPPPEYLATPDRDYALQELLALYLSLLHCLPPPVLNRPSPQGLSGHMRYTPDWLVLASRAGFATAPYVVSSSEDEPRCRNDEQTLHRPPSVHHEVVVAAGRVFGSSVTPQAAAAACRLSDLAGADLLGLRLATTADGAARFEAADLYPDLRSAGPDLLDHLAGLLKTKART
jgi:hypothetical protein